MCDTPYKELLNELSKLLNEIEQKIPNEENFSSLDIAKSLRNALAKSPQEIISQYSTDDDQITRENRVISSAVEAALLALETREFIEKGLPLQALSSIVRTAYQVGAANKTDFEIAQTKRERSDAGRASVNAKHAQNEIAKSKAIELLNNSSKKRSGWKSIPQAASAIEPEYKDYIKDKKLYLNQEATQDTLRKWMGTKGDPKVRKAYIDNASDKARERLKP